MNSSVRVYSFCWNEEWFLPYFFRHYDQLNASYVVYDNESTDSSAEIIDAHPKTERRVFSTSNSLSNGDLMEIKNECWKGDKSDWVIVCDLDELTYHRDLPGRLDALNSDVDVIRLEGYEMIVADKPAIDGPITDVVRCGVRLPMWDKSLIFKPCRLKEINYGPGGHIARPRVVGGQPRVLSNSEFMLLHCKYMSFNHVLERHKRFEERRSQRDKDNNWANHYADAPSALFEKYHDLLVHGKEII